MKNLKTLAAGAAIAGALGFAAVGVGSGVANAAPPTPGAQWAQDPGWGYGPGWHGGGRGPGFWAPPPPPPPPFYGGGYGGYGGYGPPPPPCLSGPLGFVRVCA